MLFAVKVYFVVNVLDQLNWPQLLFRLYAIRAIPHENAHIVLF